MALTDRKLLRTYPIVLAGTSFAVMENIQPNEGLRQIEHRAAGELGPVDFAIAHHEPSVQFQTPDLGKLLTLDSAILTEGVALTGNTDIQWRAEKNAGGLEAVTASSNVRARSPEAFLQVDSFRVSTNDPQPVMATCTLFLLKNSGGTPPSVVTASTALTARAAFSDSWQLGELVVDSTKWGGLMSIEYTSGINSEPRYEKGLQQPFGRRITDRKPMFRAMLKNEDILTTHGFGEVKFNSSETVDIYCRHIDEDNGGRTPETGVGNEKHFKVSLTEPVLFVNQPGDDGMVPVDIYHREGKTVTAVSNAEFPA